MDKHICSLNKRGKEILDLTLQLVHIPSITGSKGEKDIADFIHQHLSTLPYFEKFPQYLQLHPVKNTGKTNILALVKGDGSSNKTILYLGHFDTVDIGEYRSLMDIACNPAALHKRFMKEDLPPEVAEDLHSKEWLFGRGSADMKAGVAVIMRLFSEAASAPEKLTGNIALAIVSDEEADSQGMLAMAAPLHRLITQENLDMVGCINTDVVSTRDGDPANKRYIYRGSMGKILPAVYVVGKGSHVGEALDGFDANMLLSRLTWLIDNNMELSDSLDTLHSQPPVSLKQADLKEEYNGQVPYEGYAYYNFLNYRRTPEELIGIMHNLTAQAFDDCLEKMAQETKLFLGKNQQTATYEKKRPKIIHFAELCADVRKKHGEQTIKQIIHQAQENRANEMDLRDYTLSIVRAVWKAAEYTGPAAVLFLMPPYYPANDPQCHHPRFTDFYQQAENTLQKFQGKGEYQIEMKDFFPYLSDASFCAYTEGEKNRQTLEKNMPCWNQGWGIDIPLVEQLHLPVLDMGVHGKDFHKIYERVHLPYSMEILPKLIEEVTTALLHPQNSG